MNGQKFNRLLVLEEEPSRNGRKYWKCQCDCGNITSVRSDSLKSGLIKSCGCLRAENSYRTHGMYGTKIYRVWASMLSRCSNENDPAYKYYGGEGKFVDDKWTTFEGFYEDMGETYQEGFTLERKDYNLGYSKENCIWESNWALQIYNRRRLAKNVSGKTGVTVDTKTGKWRVRIGVRGKDIALGVYDDLELAIFVREEAELKYYGVIKE